MQSTYFASFLLGERPDIESPSLADGLNVIESWIFDNAFRRLERPEHWITKGGEGIDFPSGERLRVLQHYNQDKLCATGVRFEHSDPEKRLWRTDCVLSEELGETTALRFTVTVMAGSSQDSINPVFAPSSRPRVVKSMIDRFGARESFPLKAQRIRIGSDDDERFVDFLLSEDRILPIVFASRTNADNSLACNADEIADRLAGIAYVCVAEDSSLSRRMAMRLDNQLNAYDGTVRIYWPRMSRDDPPFRHRFWSRHKLAHFDFVEKSFTGQLLHLVSKASIARQINGLTRWEDIERAEITQFLRRQREAGQAALISREESANWFQQYEEDLAELDATKKALEETNRRLQQTEEELRAWKQSYIHQLRQGASRPDELAYDDLEIDDARDAIEAARRDLSERLVFVDSRIEKDAYHFEEPELLYSALKWIHDIYWPAKKGVQSCEDFDKSCREASRFRYSAHQSDVTMGMYRNDYELLHNGEKVLLKEHIAFGVSADPRKTIRVAFYYDPKDRKVIIGYIGQHQTTRSSN